MAEKAVDMAARQLGNDRPCATASEPLPGTYARRYHQLDHRLHRLEHGEMPGELICECEMVTRPQLEEALAAYGEQPVALDDLRRDLRLGMGPCQAGFCGYRAAGIVQQARGYTSQQAAQALADFVDERFKGVRPLLWGHQLRQFYLDELIYRRTLGLDALVPPPAGERADA
jgi:glycerol-3-phosphate dehydrogenase